MAVPCHRNLRTWLHRIRPTAQQYAVRRTRACKPSQSLRRQLIAHAAKTRPLTAGTLVGSGTIANQNTAKGASCLAEQRTVEALRDGKASTPFLAFGDTVRIEVTDQNGASIFGAIEQRIAQG